VLIGIVAILLLRHRRGRGNDLSTTMKYLHKKNERRHGQRLGNTIKYLQKTTSGAVGIGLCTTT